MTKPTGNNWLHLFGIVVGAFMMTSFHPLIRYQFSRHGIPKSSLNENHKKKIKLNSAIQRLPLVDSALHAWHANRHLNGAVVVAMDGEIIYEDYFGFTHPHLKSKIQPNSSFQIASVSKVFTAVAVLMLKDRGLLKLEDSVQTYFPDFPYHGITLRHLLSHQSGLPNYVYALLPKLKDCTPPDNAGWYGTFVNSDLKPLSAPGKKFHYCNTNYALLAYIVEKISGMRFHEFLKKEIFAPLQMHHTFTFIESCSMNNTCRAYTKKGKPESLDENDYILGDKGIFSTPRDLLKFSLALHGGKILSRESYLEAITPQAHEKENKDYGLGFRLKNAYDSLNKDIYHNGWWHGYRSAFHYFPADGLCIIMLSNQLDKHVYLTTTLRDLLLDKNPSPYGSTREEDP